MTAVVCKVIFIWLIHQRSILISIIWSHFSIGHQLALFILTFILWATLIIWSLYFNERSFILANTSSRDGKMFTSFPWPFLKECYSDLPVVLINWSLLFSIKSVSSQVQCILIEIAFQPLYVFRRIYKLPPEPC